jgi:DNA-binding NtrC family response regulator
MDKILVIDDDEGICYSLARLLGGDECHVTAVQTVEGGYEALRGDDYDLILLDIKIGTQDGLEVLKEIRRKRPLQLAVVMTAHGTTQTAIEAMKRGAFDYLLKPFESGVIQGVVQKALATARLQRRIGTGIGGEPLPARLPQDFLIGGSPAMQKVYKMIGQVAGREVPVLIRGESGTGKELVARALWQHSRRNGRIFLAVNCAALTETLLESELFGHERGAFTGAEVRKLGKFEQAHGGTLYLDEAGDMSLATQAKILRVLQDGTFHRVGGHETIRSDVRILAATHQDLEAKIREGSYREDLYYRLRVIEIGLPPLRERLEDIPELARFLFARHRDALGSPAQEISPRALEILKEQPWPGNVRQLENALRRALVLCNGPALLPEHFEEGEKGLQGETGSQEPERLETLVDRILASGKKDLLEEAERLLIARALERMDGNQLRTARLLGITRNTLRSRMEKFGLKTRIKVEPKKTE